MLPIIISSKLRTLFCFVIEKAYCSQSFQNKFECEQWKRKWGNVSGFVLEKVHFFLFKQYFITAFAQRAHSAHLES